MAWRLAKSLDRLRSQINALAPNRSKTSDGTVGDEKHAARKSDHNPNAAGVVTAMDITHDPAGGMDCHALASALVTSRDRRIDYIIWNRRISNPAIQNWAWRDYDGTNPHTVHLHLSVRDDLADDDDPWGLVALAPVPPVPRPAPIQPPDYEPPHYEPPPEQPQSPKAGGAGAVIGTAGVAIGSGAVAASQGAPGWVFIAGAVIAAAIIIFVLVRRKGA